MVRLKNPALGLKSPPDRFINPNQGVNEPNAGVTNLKIVQNNPRIGVWQRQMWG